MNEIVANPSRSAYEPLDRLLFSDLPGSMIRVLDGNGDEYVSGKISSSGEFAFRIGASLGTHTALILDEGRLVSTFTFRVDASTKLEDGSGKYRAFLEDLHLTVLHSCSGEGSQYVHFRGKTYFYFIRWLRDHTHTLKGMKYFHHDLKTGFELYADTQREDGMLFERIAPKRKDVQNWRDYTFKEGSFVRTVHANADGTGKAHTLQRIPVENDVEFLFIECLYHTWKATGDDKWMWKYLDNCIRALEYSITDKYRWSRKFGLLKRAYTIDTWDFIHNDDAEFTLGDNCFNPRKTVFGIMFGDNTGMAASCRFLAEMLRHAKRGKEAVKYERLSDNLLSRLENIAWNGNFYTHHVSEDPSFSRNMGGTDESRQVTLSNAYSISRGIGYDKSRSIIETYKRIRREMPKNSPGEFYNCFPPFEKGFGDQNSLWQYMNGGVSTIVAGELARGSFAFGEEKYGVDILDRLLGLAKKHEGHLHVCFNGNPKTRMPARKFKSLDLANFANVSHAWRVSGGWGEKGNDLSNMPEGTLEYHGIPFHVKDLGIGISRRRPGYADEIAVSVNAKFKSLYLLHTASAYGTASEIELLYSDGTAETEYIQCGKNIDNWFMPESGECGIGGHAPKMDKGWPEYQIAWRGSSGKFDNVGVFIWGWNNPHPEKKVSKIVFRAMKNGASYFVSAMTLCESPVLFPQSDLSFGIPDGWGASAVVTAMLEGLAGIADLGRAFSRLEISPRWSFTNEKFVKVTAKYPASGGYAAYVWEKKHGKIKLTITSSAEATELRVPIGKASNPQIWLSGKKQNFAVEKAGESRYVKLLLPGKAVHEIDIFPGKSPKK